MLHTLGGIAWLRAVRLGCRRGAALLLEGRLDHDVPARRDSHADGADVARLDQPDVVAERLAKHRPQPLAVAVGRVDHDSRGDGLVERGRFVRQNRTVVRCDQDVGVQVDPAGLVLVQQGTKRVALDVTGNHDAAPVNRDSPDQRAIVGVPAFVEVLRRPQDIDRDLAHADTVSRTYDRGRRRSPWQRFQEPAHGRILGGAGLEIGIEQHLVARNRFQQRCRTAVMIEVGVRNGESVQPANAQRAGCVADRLARVEIVHGPRVEQPRVSVSRRKQRRAPAAHCQNVDDVIGTGGRRRQDAPDAPEARDHAAQQPRARTPQTAPGAFRGGSIVGASALGRAAAPRSHMQQQQQHSVGRDHECDRRLLMHLHERAGQPRQVIDHSQQQTGRAAQQSSEQRSDQWDGRQHRREEPQHDREHDQRRNEDRLHGAQGREAAEVQQHQWQRNEPGAHADNRQPDEPPPDPTREESRPRIRVGRDLAFLFPVNDRPVRARDKRQQRHDLHERKLKSGPEQLERVVREDAQRRQCQPVGPAQRPAQELGQAQQNPHRRGAQDWSVGLDNQRVEDDRAQRGYRRHPPATPQDVPHGYPDGAGEHSHVKPAYGQEVNCPRPQKRLVQLAPRRGAMPQYHRVEQPPRLIGFGFAERREQQALGPGAQPGEQATHPRPARIDPAHVRGAVDRKPGVDVL